MSDAAKYEISMRHPSTSRFFSAAKVNDDKDILYFISDQDNVVFAVPKENVLFFRRMD